MKTKRIIINSSDIAMMYGCTLRLAQKKLKRVKIALNKPEGVTIKEYAKYYRIPINEVLESVI